MLNKELSQYIHIINSTANSGWIVEENSLVNMSTDDLEEEGAVTGIVLEFKKGTAPPQKIEPNQVPTGVDRLVQMGSTKIRTVTGISDAMRGNAGPSQSGRAIQSLQFGSQLSLAVPLDNLSRTRHMMAKRMLDLIQSYMDAPQVMRIVKRGLDGQQTTEELAISEGIETGIALHLATGKPVWAGLNAGNLEKLWLPDTVRKVCIYADNDADGDFAGQAFAFALARRLKREEKNSGRRQVRVFLPKHAGTDWADVWRQRLEAQAPRAA